MYFLKLIVALFFISVPMQITGLICLTYICLFGGFLSWVSSYDPMVAIMLMPFAFAGFVGLSVVVGGALNDHEALEQWCGRQATKAFPPPAASMTI